MEPFYEVYLDRIVDALQRRHLCVSLCKYYSYVRSMPVNERITATMTQKQFEKIYFRAASMTKLLQLDVSVANTEIDEAKRFKILRDA